MTRPQEDERFIEAGEAARAYAEQLAADFNDPEVAADAYTDASSAALKLSGLAQHYSFAQTHPDLMGTEAVDKARRQLSEALKSEDVPAGVRDEFTALYPEARD